MSSFMNELKRRKVFRVAVVYAATAFVVLRNATPNLRRALDEGGLQWAPASPIRFPAKNW